MKTKHNRIEMRQNQHGFIPMIIAILLIVAAIVWLAYSRVHSAQK